MTSLELRPDLTELPALAAAVESFGAAHGINATIIAVVQLALEDLMTSFSLAPGDIVIQLDIEDAVWLVRTEKAGDGSLATPLDLVASLMDDVRSAYGDGRHVITMRKALL